MRHIARYLPLAVVLLFGSAGLPCPATNPSAAPQDQQAAASGPSAVPDAQKQAVLANVQTFTDAFNRRDVAAILKLFTDDCELTEHDGTTVNGLKELEEELKDMFESDSKAQISTTVDSLRSVSPDVIVESGKTTFFPDGKMLTAETEYEATHVRKDGRWLMAHVRSFNRVVLSPYDQLRELEWLVGDWIDESSDSLIEASYRWDANKAFLLQDFTVRVKGQKVLSGTQRIGRDPLSKQIKAWVFDSEGGYAESLWSNVDGAWVVKAKGVRSDGKVVTVTNQLTQIGKDRMSFESVDRIVGEERMPNVSVIVVRKPPQAQR
jgi:uncharacterized protein (TIGR02246 family)